MGLSPPSQHHLGTTFKYLQPGVQGEDPGGAGRHCPKLEEVKDQQQKGVAARQTKVFQMEMLCCSGLRGERGRTLLELSEVDYQSVSAQLDLCLTHSPKLFFFFSLRQYLVKCPFIYLSKNLRQTSYTHLITNCQGDIITFFLQVRKLRLRVAKDPGCGHISRGQQSQDLNSRLQNGKLHTIPMLPQ